MLPLIPLALAAAGTATSLYGANRQSKDQAAADAANRAAVEKADQRAWLNYLVQRGVNPDPSTPFGTIPGAQPGGAVNTRLPLWWNVRNVAPTTAAPGANANTPFLRRKGA